MSEEKPYCTILPCLKEEEGVGKLGGVSVAIQTETDTHSRINPVSINVKGRDHQRTDEKTEMFPGRAQESNPRRKNRNQRKRISRKKRNQVRTHYKEEGGSSKEMIVKLPVGTNSQILTFSVDTGSQR